MMSVAVKPIKYLHTSLLYITVLKNLRELKDLPTWTHGKVVFTSQLLFTILLGKLTAIQDILIYIS